jgi:hypothetical protein
MVPARDIDQRGTWLWVLMNVEHIVFTLELRSVAKTGDMLPLCDVWDDEARELATMISE